MNLSLQQIKQHLRVDETDNTEDALITMYQQSAMQYVAKYLGEDLPDPIPAPIEACVLLLTADMYENRERQGPEVFYQNHTYKLLLNPYRSAEVF